MPFSITFSDVLSAITSKTQEHQRYKKPKKSTSPPKPYQQPFIRSDHFCADPMMGVLHQSFTDQEGLKVVTILDEQEYLGQQQELDQKLRYFNTRPFTSSVSDASSSSSSRSLRWGEIRLTRTVCRTCGVVYRIKRETDERWHLLTSEVTGPSWYQETFGTREERIKQWNQYLGPPMGPTEKARKHRQRC